MVSQKVLWRRYKAFIKPFEGPQSAKIKISLTFLSSSKMRTGRVNQIKGTKHIRTTMSISVVCVSDTSKSFLSCGIPYLENIKRLMKSIFPGKLLFNFKDGWINSNILSIKLFWKILKICEWTLFQMLSLLINKSNLYAMRISLSDLLLTIVIIIIIRFYFWVWPEGHQKPCNEVGSRSSIEHLVWFESVYLP